MRVNSRSSGGASAVFSPDTGRHLRHTLTVDIVSQRVAEMYPGYGFFCGVALMCVIGSVAGAPPSNYEKSDETKWGLRSVDGNPFVTSCFPSSVGGMIRHVETGVSGNYLTLEFRDVIADALDLIDKHVTDNYSRLERGDDWFYIMLASIIGVQLEIVWLIVQIVWQKRRGRRISVKKEDLGGTHERARV